MSSKWKSRKFILTLVSAMLVVLNDSLALGLSNNTMMMFATIVVGWVLGESHIDARYKLGGYGNGNDNGNGNYFVSGERTVGNAETVYTQGKCRCCCCNKENFTG